MRNLRVPALRTVSAYLTILLALVFQTGCRGERMQSVLHPESGAARSLATLWWVLLTVLTAYTLGVFVLTFMALRRRAPSEEASVAETEAWQRTAMEQAEREATAPAQPLALSRREAASDGQLLILLGGIVFPSLILVPLLVYSVTLSSTLRLPETGLSIRVVGHMWWWEVEYPGTGYVGANEIVIPAGEPVRLELTSGDVIHSWWVPQLHGKHDMIPGRVNYFWVEADRPGVYRGQCAEFCGDQHAHMAFLVIALEPQEFQQWLDQRQNLVRRAPRIAGNPQLELGEELFFRRSCAACHAVAGTRATSRVGPDLSDYATRQTLAAATLPNTEENLRAWLLNPQGIKPGAKMPATELTPEELDALVAYMLSLKPDEVQP
jgi:cytochrome c oxidase subunit II